MALINKICFIASGVTLTSLMWAVVSYSTRTNETIKNKESKFTDPLVWVNFEGVKSPEDLLKDSKQKPMDIF